MDRSLRTTWAVCAGLAALLLSTIAYGLGVGEWIVFVGLAVAPLVMLLTYRKIRP